MHDQQQHFHIGTIKRREQERGESRCAQFRGVDSISERGLFKYSSLSGCNRSRQFQSSCDRGWIQRHAIQAGADEFNRGSYERIFTTGGPENGSGGYVNDYQTSASVGVEALKEAGIPEEVVQMAPSHVIDQERTYSAAIALRDWLGEHNITVQSMNVLTEDAHARRTQLLYRKAFGKKVLVGIIAVSNPDYNPKYWWRYSDGVREVIGESIAYIYARFLFYPPASLRDKKMTQASQHPADTQQ